MTEPILFYSRRTDYGWLSNFDKTPETLDGFEYQSNEHFYQSQKAIKDEQRTWIAAAPTPYLAMIAGRALRPEKGEVSKNWDNEKTDVMLKGLRAKFQTPGLKKKLLDTGDAELHEDSPTDMFWGIKGKDMLGKLLMQVRDEIRNNKTTCAHCVCWNQENAATCCFCGYHDEKRAQENSLKWLDGKIEQMAKKYPRELGPILHKHMETIMDR